MALQAAFWGTRLREGLMSVADVCRLLGQTKRRLRQQCGTAEEDLGEVLGAPERSLKYPIR